MKNNIFKILIVLFCFLQNNLFAEQFNIESSEINILKKEILLSKKWSKYISSDGVEIITNKVVYEKKRNSYYWKCKN